VAEDDWTSVFRVDEFGEEDVKRTANGIKCKEASVFGESEECESDAEGERSECRLQGATRISDGREGKRIELTSIAIPGTNIKTAKA